MAPFICLCDHDEIVKSRRETLFIISKDENISTIMIEIMYDYKVLMEKARMEWIDKPILTVDEIYNFNKSINCMICSCLFTGETGIHRHH